MTLHYFLRFVTPRCPILCPGSDLHVRLFHPPDVWIIHQEEQTRQSHHHLHEGTGEDWQARTQARKVQNKTEDAPEKGRWKHFEAPYTH